MSAAMVKARACIRSSKPLVLLPLRRLRCCLGLRLLFPQTLPRLLRLLFLLLALLSPDPCSSLRLGRLSCHTLSSCSVSDSGLNSPYCLIITEVCRSAFLLQCIQRGFLSSQLGSQRFQSPLSQILLNSPLLPCPVFTLYLQAAAPW